MSRDKGPVLRPYQAAVEAPLRAALTRHRAVAVISPTGSGKGVQIADLSAAATEKDRRVMVIVHRAELVTQTLSALAAFDIDAGVIAAGHPEKPEAQVQVASVMTLTQARRLARWAQWKPDLVLVDECHHVRAHCWQAIIEVLPYSRLVGFTATPTRLDGKGLGQLFGEIITVATVKELIADGWLSPVKVFAPPVLADLSRLRTRAGEYVAEDAAAALNQAQFTGDAVEHYRRHFNGAPALGYAVNIQHSQALAAAFRAAGFRAQHVDADTSAKERAAAVAALGSGALNILFNVQLFTEGLDLPTLSGVLLLRPTMSLALYLQMCGRALRPAPGKEITVILDHCRNCERHGLPDWDHEWSLEDRPKNSGAAPVRRCPECGAMVPLAAWTCPNCGHVLRTPEVAPVHAPGELVEPQPAEIERARLRLISWREQSVWAGASYRRLLLLADSLGFHPGWARHELQRVLDAQREGRR